MADAGGPSTAPVLEIRHDVISPISVDENLRLGDRSGLGGGIHQNLARGHTLFHERARDGGSSCLRMIEIDVHQARVRKVAR